MKVNPPLLVLIFVIAGLLCEISLKAQDTAALYVNVTTLNSCGDNGGIAYINIEGGEPFYNYTLPPYTPSGTFFYANDTINSLPVGIYQMLVFDQYGDSSGIINFQIGSSPALSINQNIIHHGDCLDTVIVTPSGDPPPYFYYWSTGAGAQGDSIQQICSGQDYTLTVMDVSGNCLVAFDINDTFPVLNLNSTIVKNISCHGDCNGEAVLTAINGIPPYGYIWQTIPPQYTDTAINLCPGTYQVILTDSTATQFTTEVNIPGPYPLVLSVDYVSYGNCHDSAFGVARGGTPPYQYKWNSQPTSSNYSFGNICLGEHDTLKITDAHGCSGIYYAIDGGSPPPPSVCYSFSDYIVPLDSQQQAFYYYGDGHPGFLQDWHVANGTPAIQPGAGTILPYHGAAQLALIGVCDIAPQSWSEGLELAYNFDQGSSYKVSLAVASLDLNNGLNPIDVQFILLQDTINYVYGSYNSGCSPTPDIPEGALIVDSLINFEDSSWQVISFDINHLTSSYSQLWIRIAFSPGAPVITTFLVMDSICVQPIYNMSPPTLSANATIVNAVTCKGYCNGSAAVTTTGGTPPYSYMWNTSPKQTTDTAINLCAGTYSVMVYDSVHDSTSASVTLSQPALLYDSIKAAICYGQSYQGHNATGYYTDTFNGKNGCDSIVFLNLFADSFISSIDKERICKGDTFNGHTIAGYYYDTLTSLSGCDSIVTLELQVDTLPSIPVIVQWGDTLTTTQFFFNYYWYNADSVLISNSGSVLVITSSGNYYVQVVDSNSSCRNGSTLFYAVYTGIGHLVADTPHLIIYPNPGDGIFYIEAKGNEPAQNVTVLNALGQVVFYQAFEQKTVTPLLKVDCGNLAAGIYFMKINTADELITKPVMIR